MKRISMIVPVYNAEAFLRELVESLLSQDWENLQILLSDDGSTDESLALMNALAERDPRITVVTGPNTGVSSARNRALRLADGDYIGFADSDDILEPGYLPALASALGRAGRIWPAAAFPGIMCGPGSRMACPRKDMRNRSWIGTAWFG